MQPQPKPLPTPDPRAALNVEEAVRQNVLAAFLKTESEKPAVPLRVGLNIHVQGDNFQATTLSDGVAVELVLSPLPEKAAAEKTANPVVNVVTP
jgi:hypothetical protein